MPFAMKIQPIDSDVGAELVKPVAKSRLKRLFERQLFSGVLRNSAAEKIAVEEAHSGAVGNGCTDLEPSSVCLAKMVQNFMEENHEKHSVSVRCSRNRCNCFNGNCDDSSDAESNGSGESSNHRSSSGEALEILKGLVACVSVCERNLLADTAKIVENNKMICKRKDSACREVVTEGLLALGYDASVCKSRWEKSPFYPAGEYEYIDVIIGDEERVLIDVDFRSEFEIARPTKAYKAILQTLPYMFVGKCDRLQSIVAIVCEAAKQSLKKKGMHVPPWRKVEYVKAKWLSPHSRTTTPSVVSSHGIEEDPKEEQILMGNNNGDELDESKLVIQVKPTELKPKSSLSALAVVLNEN